MDYYLIENEGELDVREIYKMGVTSKEEDDDNIGQFGTGFKKGTIALNRGGYNMRIFIGEKEIVSEFKPVDPPIKGKNYIDWWVNGVNTQLTTSMDRLTWNTHDGIRELVCNAKDEGITFKGVTDEVIGREGHVRVFLEYRDGVKDYFMNYNEHMSDDKHVIFQHKKDKVFMKHSNRLCIYRKSVRVNVIDNTVLPSVFDYELNALSVNDDRVNHSVYDQIRYTWKLLIKMNEPVYIRKLLEEMEAGNKVFEWSNFHYVSKYLIQDGFNKAWEKACEGYTLIPNRFKDYTQRMPYKNMLVVPNDFYDTITKQFPNLSFASTERTDDGLSFIRQDLTNEQIDILLQLKKEFDSVGLFCDAPVKGAIFDDINTVAAAFNYEEMLFSEKFFTSSKDRQRRVYFEEIAHVISKASDHTREFQDYTIGVLINYLTPELNKVN